MVATSVEVLGLEELGDLKGLDKRVRSAASKALNQTATQQRTVAARRILDQSALPRGYIAPRNKRFYVSKRARPDTLESRITARGRRTSLSRFIRGKPARGGPLKIVIKPGYLRSLDRAFLLRVRRGDGLSDTQFNLALAVRVSDGDSIRNSSAAVEIFDNVFLLYGPSVQQLFIDNRGRGVAEEIEDETVIRLSNNFLRLLDLANL